MEPEKLSADIPINENSPETTNEISPEELLSKLDALLDEREVVDEHLAKRLRKAWDALSGAADVNEATVVALKNGFETLRERIHKQVEARNLRYLELEEKLANLKSSVQDDDLKSAQQLENEIISNLNKITGLSTQRRQRVIRELEALQPKIKKLASWRHWGTNQARENIIKEMQHIHDKETDLEKIARRIKQAREQWKQWDNSGEGGDHKLYKTFDNACSNAYEPCKAFFESQRQKRLSSSRERSEICELLEAEYEKTDWRNPEWKKLQQCFREQVTRWRKLGPAEYKDRKTLHRRFEQITEKFSGPLDRERKRNMRQREELIGEIVKLVELEDSRKAITALQSLKKKWLVTVSGKRNQEKAIWKKFTSACDAVYDKSRQSKKEFDQQLNQNLQSRETLCEQIEKSIRDTKNSDPQDISSAISQWKQQWSDLGRVPKGNAKKVEKRFRDALHRLDTVRLELLRVEQSKTDRILFDCAAFCTELEQQLLENIALEADSAKQRWHQFETIEDDLKSSLQERIDQVLKAATDSDYRQAFEQSLDRNFEHINRYLLQLEINTGIESPAQYAKQRMELQISRLSTALGKDTEQELLSDRELIHRIHTTGAVPLTKQQELDQRFTKCYQVLNNANN